MSSELWKEDTLEGLGKGSRVWFRTKSGTWQQATLQSVTGSTCSLATDSPLGEGTGKPATCDLSGVLPANPPLLEQVPDLTTLSFLNEPSILHTLHQRYNEDSIYTHAGPVLIAVNPFKNVELYTPEHVQHYVNRPPSGSNSTGYDPHIFLTADKAYKQMVANKASQSILITGESGAGKTETTKFVMKYLAGLAGGTGMEDRVLDTNPILEAFGNAKTIHNKNSSRFGKLIEIYFNRSHSICGALIQTYLLEKSRVVHQLPGERSYHVFYQLCRGASAEERAECLLPGTLEEFAYLNKSGCNSIDGVDDAAEFKAVKHAMATVGISKDQQRGIWKVLSAVLWLGNVKFIPVKHRNSDAVEVAGGPSGHALESAAQLLGIPPRALAAALTTRRMVAGGEEITKELSLDVAIENRDALAKAVYEAQFRWLVNQINEALTTGRAAAATSLCILDIYGFECFQENSFEQLCINYANERLQQQFAAHLFKIEQQVYEEEGVDWARVEFQDNQECVDMIEARPPSGVGLLSLLDEECMFPKGSDSSWAAKVRQRLVSHPRFSFNPKSPGDSFTLHHYAGPVAYSAVRFLDKNRDALSPDLVVVLAESDAALVVALSNEMSKGQERSRAQTVGARFRDQLKDLMTRLDETELHFVRCIKPNGKQAASFFDPVLALHQLRCCGVLEVARIARAGYPTRYLHSEFAERYRILLPGLPQGKLPSGVSALDLCRRLLEHFNVAPELHEIGHTKIFFRAGVLGQLEDRAARIQRSVLVLQSTWRMLAYRRAFLRSRTAATFIQAVWRGRDARRAFVELQRRNAAAKYIQSAWKTKAIREDYLRSRAAVVAIQMGWRRYQFESRAAVIDNRLRKEEAKRKAEEAARLALQESYDALKGEFGVDGAGVREILTVWQKKGPKLADYDALEAEFGVDAAAVREILKSSRQQGSVQASYDALEAEFGVDAGRLREILSTWQAQGSKLELYNALEAQFGVDHVRIREIIELSEVQGAKWKAYADIEKEYGADAPKIRGIMAIWEAQGSKLEAYNAMESEFKVNSSRVREVLTIWRDHGSRFDKYLKWQAAGGAKSAAAAAAQAAAAAKAGMGAAEAAHAEVAIMRAAKEAADAEVSVMRTKVSELECQVDGFAQLRRYVEQLEAETQELRVEAYELREENYALMEARQATLAAEAAAAGGSKGPGVISVVAAAGPLMDDGQPGSAGSVRSEDTVSIMSYDGDAPGTDMTHVTAATTASPASASRSRGVAVSPSPSFGRAGALGAVAALDAEMEKKTALFDDDAAFISEVHDGISQAPNMDPHMEIERLLYRYKMWQKDFKMRLKATQSSLKRQANSPSPYSGNGPDSPAMSAESAGGLTARLRRLAHVGSSAKPSPRPNSLYG